MFTHARSPRFLHALVLTLAIAASTPIHASACDCGKSTKPHVPTSATLTSSASTTTDSKPTPKKHPLKGIVTDLLPGDSALMVKHEAIPGVMKAMTMMLTVDPAVLSRVKKGDAITGLLYRDAEGTWRLDDVKVIPPASPAT